MTTPDTTLRDDLTGFTEGLETGKYHEVAKWLRALLAAHPAPETGEMQTQARICPACYDDHSARQRCTPAPVSDTRREAAEALCTADSSYWHHEQTDGYPCTDCVEKANIVLAVLNGENR